MIKTPDELYKEIVETYLLDINTEILRTWDKEPGADVYWTIPEKATRHIVAQLILNLETCQWNVFEKLNKGDYDDSHFLIISEKENHI